MADIEVKTQYGTVYINAQRLDTIWAGFSRDSYQNGERVREGIVIRGKTYYGSAHLYLWRDGQFHIGKQYKECEEWQGGSEEGGPSHKALVTRETSPYDRSHDLHIHDDWNGKKFVPASESARKAIFEAVTTAVNQWAGQNRTSLIDAESTYQQEQIANEEEKIAELQKEIETRQAKIVELQANIANCIALMSKELV